MTGAWMPYCCGWLRMNAKGNPTAVVDSTRVQLGTGAFFFQHFRTSHWWDSRYPSAFSLSRCFPRRVSDSGAQAVSAIAKAAGIPHACDSTFATPIMMKPLELGADMTVQVSKTG